MIVPYSASFYAEAIFAAFFALSSWKNRCVMSTRRVVFTERFMQIAETLTSRLSLFVAGIFVSLAWTGSAKAVAVYTYTGPTFDQIFNSPDVPNTYTTSDRITASVTFQNALAPNSNNSGTPALDFWISDGRAFLTAADIFAPGSSLTLFTDSTGNISGWGISVHTPEPNVGELYAEISTFGGGISSPPINNHAALGICTEFTSFCSNFVFDIADNSHVEGIWSRVVTDDPVLETPLPSTLPLFASTIIAFGWLARRRARIVT
jgi:hypothetical protein